MLKLRHPSNMIVSGMSQSGKTSLVRNLIKSDVYDHPMKRILFCYSTFQPWFLETSDIEFMQGLPKNCENFDLIVIDDLMNSLTAVIADLFAIGSHHKRISVILILQNLYPKCKVMRDISLNTHYFILFRNTRDQSQLMCFARQVFPYKTQYFLSAYKSSTSKPYSYLLVDCHPLTDDSLRLRENIFADNNGIYWGYIERE